MKFSVNSLRELQSKYHWSDDFMPDGFDALVRKIGAQLGGIEAVIDSGAKYDGVLIVEVVACEPHSNADRLHICLVDDGMRASNVERTDDGYVRVVCGAPNVRSGMRAAWLPPGVTVPSTIEHDPLVMESREIRGIRSNGMMASPKELGISDSHSGILEIDDPVAPGTLFEDYFKLDGDHIIDIENKMFTHRPDCFGTIGIARELAGIQGMPFQSPDWYKANQRLPDAESNDLKLEIRNEIPKLVPRFMAAPIKGVVVKTSPVWLQLYLSRIGIRPINNIVDLTNYYMVLTGQPLHAYDYDKVRTLDGNAEMATIVVRMPKKNEEIVLLNGKAVKPRPEAILIATKNVAIGIGGVMGGSDTEVDEHTENIIIECASFDMYSIRRTSMAHGLFAEAVTRYTKGQSPLQNPAVIARIIAEIKEIAGGMLAGTITDLNSLDDAINRRSSLHLPVALSAEYINKRLGIELHIDDIAAILRNVEFDVKIADGRLTVEAPFWRTDIEAAEDIVEEVGRLYGYDKLRHILPVRDISPAKKDPVLTLKSEIRAIMRRCGANELLTYSFVHGNLIDKVDQDRSLAFRLDNALSPDLQYYRLSILPSLLERVHKNIKAGFGQFCLFELGKAHSKTKLDNAGLPLEDDRLSFVYAADNKAGSDIQGAPYYQALKYVRQLLCAYHCESQFELIPIMHAAAADGWLSDYSAPFEPKRSSFIRDIDGNIWGIIGEFRRSVVDTLKLPEKCSGFELNYSVLLQREGKHPYTPLPRFPKVEQDICFRVGSDVAYQTLLGSVEHSIEKLIDTSIRLTISPLDIYKQANQEVQKQITFRVQLSSYDRTLTTAEVAQILDTVAADLSAELQAVRV